jgi:translocation and assembly module TamA
VEWQEGAVYDERLVNRTQSLLFRTGLFSTVRVARAADVPEDGAIPMVIEVAERKHRTISAGVQYRTDEGGSLRLRWEHRNHRGLGRTLAYDAHLGQIQTSLETSYTLRRWRQDNQTLELSAHVGEWSPEAYTSRRIGAQAWVERDIDGPWSIGTGLAVRWDDIEQKDSSEQYHLLSNPWRLTWATIDDPLNPTDGRRITLNAEPFAGVGGGALFFAKGEVQYSEYFPLDDAKDWLLAVRSRVGLSTGASRDEMPPDERFYAGGAASIRGYAYQTVGPLDDDDPIGGRSVFDMSVELRRRITKDIGVVVFVDGGSSFEDAFPTFQDMHWGAGVGLRYFTGIGPVGLDIAVPLNKRGFDDSFQVYITLGQAF